MSDALTRKIEGILRASAQEDHAGYWEAHVPSAARAIAALIAEERTAARKEGCAWAEAIERWFVEWEMLPDWSAADPWAELHRMICWEQRVALDPAVSEDARKLIGEERARAFEDTAERAAGMWPRGSLHTSASENADRYSALEDASEHIAAAIRALAKKEQTRAQEEIALTPQHQRVMRRALAASVKPVSEETPDGN